MFPEPFNNNEQGFILVLLSIIYPASKRAFDMFLSFSTLSMIPRTSNAKFIACLIIISRGPRNPFEYKILDNLVFSIFILCFIEKPFVKILQSLKTCVSINNNLCGKLVSSLESPMT